MMKLGVTLSLLLLGTTALVAGKAAGRAYTWSEEYPMYDKTLRHQLIEAGVTTFLSHLDKAGLGYLLDGKGIYTVFAPTNQAFKIMIEDNSCKAEYEPGYEPYSKDRYRPTYSRYLRPTILRQMILGRYQLHNLLASNGALIPSNIDVPVAIFTYGNTVVVNGGRIIKGDYHASNGVVHVVDSIYCLQMNSTLDILRSYSEYNGYAFIHALAEANWLPWLQFGQSVTILVPSRAELQELLYGGQYYENYEYKKTGSKLQEFVKSRVLFGLYYPENLRHLRYVRSISGKRLYIAKHSAEEVLIDGKSVHLGNIRVTRNGVIYLPQKYDNYDSYVGRSYGMPPPPPPQPPHVGGSYGSQQRPGMYYPPPMYPPPPPNPPAGYKPESEGDKKGLLSGVLSTLGLGGGGGGNGLLG